jgi:hypothetical protein
VIIAGVAAAVLAALLALLLVVCCKRRSASKAHPHAKPRVRLRSFFYALLEGVLHAFTKRNVVHCYQTTQRGRTVRTTLCAWDIAWHGKTGQFNSYQSLLEKFPTPQFQMIVPPFASYHIHSVLLSAP